MQYRLWVVLAALLAIAGCGKPERDAATDAQIRGVYDDLRLNREADLQARMAPALRAAITSDDLGMLRGSIPGGQPRARRALGIWRTQTPAGDRLSATDEYDYPGKTALVLTQLSRSSPSQPWQVSGFNVQIASDADLAVNDLTLSGKPARQLLFLAFAIASPLLMLAALTLVMLTRELPWKLAWAIGSFAGLSQMTMNWTTGALHTNLYSVQLLGAGVARLGGSHFLPWSVMATAPVGAVIVLAALWWRRRGPVRAVAQAGS